MSEPRFYVDRLVGYSINRRPGQTGAAQRVSYYVYDRLRLHTIVARFEATVLPRHLRQRGLYNAAHAECERLNEWWRAELARD